MSSCKQNLCSTLMGETLTVANNVAGYKNCGTSVHYQQSQQPSALIYVHAAKPSCFVPLGLKQTKPGTSTHQVACVPCVLYKYDGMCLPCPTIMPEVLQQVFNWLKKPGREDFCRCTMAKCRAFTCCSCLGSRAGQVTQSGISKSSHSDGIETWCLDCNANLAQPLQTRMCSSNTLTFLCQNT